MSDALWTVLYNLQFLNGRELAIVRHWTVQPKRKLSPRPAQTAPETPAEPKVLRIREGAGF